MRDESTRFLAALMGSRLCLRCTSIKSDVVEDRLVGVIRAMQRHITVVEIVDSCDGCGRRTVVYKTG